MTTRLVVLIAACGQPELLRRTLRSLAACDKPTGYDGVIVAENGRRAGLEAVVGQFFAEHRFQYLYSEPPNKSLALNRALADIDDALVVFTDDDVCVPKGTLVAYAEAAAASRGGEFYGGPIVPDFEDKEPPSCLLRYLPRSAAGWNLDVSVKTPISQPEFIGPNFAAFAGDILRVGGFDTRLGPGRHMASPGEDTEIQERLLGAGVRGYFLPEAPIRHLVRRGNTSPEFALERAGRNGIYWGISQARRPGFFPRRWLKIHGQWLNDRWRIARWGRSTDEATAFRGRFTAARWQGRWAGIRLGWNWGDRPMQQPGSNLVPAFTGQAARAPRSTAA
jgi:GT2 family glycosyltransferase